MSYNRVPLLRRAALAAALTVRKLVADDQAAFQCFVSGGLVTILALSTLWFLPDQTAGSEGIPPSQIAGPAAAGDVLERMRHVLHTMGGLVVLEMMLAALGGLMMAFGYLSLLLIRLTRFLVEDPPPRTDPPSALPAPPKRPGDT